MGNDLIEERFQFHLKLVNFPNAVFIAYLNTCIAFLIDTN